jgi:PelA/Pel-15E family pectate lyase
MSYHPSALPFPALLLLLAFGLQAPALALEPIDISAFADSAHHWRHVNNGGGPTAPVSVDQPVYAPSQVREIAANILFFQLDNGSWPKNYDMRAILTPGQKTAIAAAKKNRLTVTFDNETTHSQVAYLARAFEQLKDPACRDACVRGLDFMLSAQLPGGGFPQRWPNPESYHAYITFNDRVMVGILTVLRDAGNGANGFAWLDAERREKCRAAQERGTACILACQYRDARGALVAWGQQHDPKTLLPAKGRGFELPSLCAQDTPEVIRYLLGFENPSPEIIAAVRAGVAWLEKSKITGIRVEEFKSTPVEFRFHKTDIDRRVVEDPNAPPVWARMYEMETNRPMFCGRDQKKVYTFAEVDRDRRTGYDWYGYWPAGELSSLLPAWLKKHGLSKK